MRIQYIKLMHLQTIKAKIQEYCQQIDTSDIEEKVMLG